MLDRYVVQVNGRVVEVRPKTERNRVNRQKRRARKLGLRCDLLYEEWIMLLLRFGFKCAYCGGAVQTIDHILPIVNGGGTTLANVLPACRDCNELKGVNVLLPARAGAVCYGR